MADNLNDCAPAVRTVNNGGCPAIRIVGGGGGKNGVISQTQTWRGAQTEPQTYTMSDIVTGTIPQASIDIFQAAGAVFNETTGYFELNGLTDISYQEMCRIFAYTSFMFSAARDKQYWATGATGKVRTPLPIGTPAGGYSSVSANINTLALGSNFETINATVSPLRIQNNPNDAFNGNNKLRLILFEIDAQDVTSWQRTFNSAYSLEDVQIRNLKASITFDKSANLTVASVLYMIQNEAATSAITITLHATAYALAIADADVQTALAAHPNVTLASA